MKVVIGAYKLANIPVLTQNPLGLLNAPPLLIALLLNVSSFSSLIPYSQAQLLCDFRFKHLLMMIMMMIVGLMPAAVRLKYPRKKFCQLKKLMVLPIKGTQYSKSRMYFLCIRKI